MITIYKCCAAGSIPVQLGNTSGAGAGKCRSTEINNNVLPSNGTIWGTEHTKISRKEGKRFKMTNFFVKKNNVLLDYY
jgi:hypothetical protein